jgi:hypothetical protein
VDRTVEGLQWKLNTPQCFFLYLGIVNPGDFLLAIGFFRFPEALTLFLCFEIDVKFIMVKQNLQQRVVHLSVMEISLCSIDLSHFSTVDNLVDNVNCAKFFVVGQRISVWWAPENCMFSHKNVVTRNSEVSTIPR